MKLIESTKDFLNELLIYIRVDYLDSLVEHKKMFPVQINVKKLHRFIIIGALAYLVSYVSIYLSFD